MKKRSAMAIAAGLVAALLTGAVALSLGLSSTQTADATGERLEPRVRTVHRTVTVHRDAKAEEPETVTVVTASASSPESSDDDGQDGEDGAFEDDDFEDDEEDEDDFEDEDREDEHEEDDSEDGDD